MKRLIVISTIVISTFLVPFAADAEDRLIAVIMATSQPRYQEIHATFAELSGEFCGSGCRLYVQKPHADTMSLRNSVRKAVALGAELIVTYGPEATIAAQLEAPPAPILFADVYDPVKLGLVSEKTGVGTRMTGVRGDAPVQALFKYFVESTDTDTLAILYDAESQVALLQEATLSEAGKRRKINVLALATSGSKGHLEALAKMPAETDGLYLATSELAPSQLAKVVSFATERKVPVITMRSGAADDGAFMTLETSAEEQGKKLAVMAQKLLSGTAIKDLPMEKPHDVFFIVNLRAAQACDIKVPFTVLSNATSVVR